MATVIKYCSNYACTLFAPTAVLTTKGFHAVRVTGSYFEIGMGYYFKLI
jgi:hypothetical protein